MPMDPLKLGGCAKARMTRRCHGRRVRVTLPVREAQVLLPDDHHILSTSLCSLCEEFSKRALLRYFTYKDVQCSAVYKSEH